MEWKKRVFFVQAQAMSRERFLIENIFFCEKLYFL